MQSRFDPEKVTADDAVVWHENTLFLLDQRVLPQQVTFVELNNATETANAITEMVVRGAPAIGITAAYGMVLAARAAYQAGGADQWRSKIRAEVDLLRRSRPTAVNLFWAIERMEHLMRALPDESDPTERLQAEAKAIHQEDIAANRTMGDLGADLIATGSKVITHCNAGALATGGYGTALGVIRSAFKKGKLSRVYADETRPWLQGARLTAWELLQDRIPVTLLADGAAASLMRQGEVDWVVVGSDRIAANGDVANKIGTYHLIVAAKHHQLKVMVAAPTSTIDMSLPSGAEIPIEVRDGAEIESCGNKRVAADGAEVWNPVFDVTPAGMVDAIVTEKGVVHAPNEEKMRKLMIN
ncbi:MAG: S-methyl-5-thioribose-1-phosphate isomerase [Candidatus Thiodiazotropha lotti]|nr:S-methyl-5-thioribose-1-phosphate isomerase [Candidatus Thiodiazotropha lotti]MCG7988733.1 S-methyl-5-thioribose-1-phosphate isomerase [Candidatus Thiodiazotropha lotti]MCG8004783.1 S-methyl-5-thioribose-1-phosphate isomerase [Candidatus Thiodiazotropha lotti]MCG8006747.1 S-methyl-5-thioribose-1-phosphate isomerase [Candidatus Thiodiazotropha lotti]MCG8014396.1 S-methyl-5-thioribose-1-phosphate isomerase [Candidatus Thiodiazotropha lotti]